MEENTENTEGQRVTRARTRRMSLLDTDSRPGTPQLDTASDRGTASPRPTRRARLNSVTLDVRTPTRPTRASLARGETPEPTTPSSVKRTARTPAKARSVRQQLTLKEEEAEEIEVKQVEKPGSRSNTPTPTGEKRVTRSMSQTPPNVTRPLSQPDLNTSLEDKQKRALESVDKPQVEKQVRAATSIKTQTPKVSVRLEKLKMAEKAENVLPKEIEHEKILPINPSVVEGSTNDHKQSVDILDSGRSQTAAKINNTESQASVLVLEPKTVSDTSEPSEKTMEMQPATESLPVRSPEKNDSLEEQFLDAEESPLRAEPQKDERVSEMVQDSKVELQVMPKPAIAEPPEASKREDTTIETPKAENISEPDGEITLPEAPNPLESTIETPREEIISEPEEEITPPETPMDVDEEIGLPKPEKPENTQNQDLTADINPRVAEQKRFVGFNSDTVDSDVEKKRFPKTPGREKVQASFNFTPKPMKTDVEQRRNSSTPILKHQEPELFLGKTELQPPPLQIDAIKPFEELEKTEDTSLVQPTNMSPKKAVNKILALLESDDEPEEIMAEEGEGDDSMSEFIDKDAEEEDDESMCEFVDNVAEEAPADYQSGDSMNSSDRREIEENEIHCDGESVGSQDTDEESTGDSNESNDSFVVPDDDVEEDLDPLCYSSDEEGEVENEEPKDKKKRRRILVAESSDDEKQEKEKEQNRSQLTKSKDQSNGSSDVSKLSEAAQLVYGSAEKSSTSETELENSRIMALSELNKSEMFNKTATRLDASVLELDSTDNDKDEAEEDGTENGNSVVEIADSDEDGEVSKHMVEEEESVVKSSKSADEETLLADLASSDLRHLETMFNPLQKSRRQSLIMPSHELAAKEPKLKRRSDRALGGSDFCPSQSFVEMIDEHKRVKNKRKRLSKSFSGAAEDLEEMGGIHHERKRLKSSGVDFTESLEDDDDQRADAAPVEDSADMETSGPEITLQESHSTESNSAEQILQSETIPKVTPERNVEKITKNVSVKKSPAKETSFTKLQTPQPTWEADEAKEAEDKTFPSVKASTSKGTDEPSSEPRTAEYYLEYCNSILQKANEAVLRKKKEDIAAGKTQKKQKRPAATAASKSEQAMPVPIVPAVKQASKPPLPVKKDLKRLQAARQAVGHAVSLLAPGKIVAKEPRSLARKLSPQPPKEAKKETKNLKKTKKQKLPETSPLKSSDEENHGNRFRTNAGFVTVSRIDSPPRAPIIELIKTSSGIMRVEPTTPKQKYFRELPATPKNNGFQERPVSSGHSKKRAKQKALQAAASGKQNPAMQTALRFKEHAFARKF